MPASMAIFDRVVCGFFGKIPDQREVHAMVSPMWLDACVCLCGMLTLVPVCLGARQLN